MDLTEYFVLVRLNKGISNDIRRKAKTNARREFEKIGERILRMGKTRDSKSIKTY